MSKILIVDDQPSNLLLLERVLDKKGYQVIQAKSGEECLRRVQEGEVDLILLDIMMPVMDGFQTAMALQEQPRSKDIPIIFLTALTAGSDMLSGFEAGGVDYITKPFHPAELLARVNTHIKLRMHEQELAEANQIKDKFFNIMAHDLRSPFDGIVSLMNLILEDWEDQTLEELKPVMESLNQSAQAGRALTNELMDWASMQTGRLEINILPIEVESVAQEVCDLLADSAMKKGVTLEHQLNGVRVMADRYMLATIFRNLLNNAIKFSHQDTTVRITALSQGEQVKIMVQDQGVGIPLEYQSKLFLAEKPFTTRGTGEEKGTGLGLILCQEFIQAMGGELDLESAEGEGSTFILLLTACDEV